MNKHKLKHHRNSDTKNRQQRTTPEQPLVMNNLGLKLVLRVQSSPSVTDVVQTFSLLLGSHNNPLTRQWIITIYRKIKGKYYEEAKTRT